MTGNNNKNLEIMKNLEVKKTRVFTFRVFASVLVSCLTILSLLIGLCYMGEWFYSLFSERDLILMEYPILLFSITIFLFSSSLLQHDLECSKKYLWLMNSEKSYKKYQENLIHRCILEEELNPVFRLEDLFLLELVVDSLSTNNLKFSIQGSIKEQIMSRKLDKSYGDIDILVEIDYEDPEQLKYLQGIISESKLSKEVRSLSFTKFIVKQIPDVRYVSTIVEERFLIEKDRTKIDLCFKG